MFQVLGPVKWCGYQLLRLSSCTQYNTYLMNRKTRSTTPTTSSPLTRLRSDSIKSDPGTNTSSQPARLESPRSPGLNNSLLLLTVDKSRPGSPSVLETLSDSNSSSDKDSKKKGNSLKRCPCGLSSGGKAWILKCSSCTQMWHNSCANLNTLLASGRVC